ncbi:synaptobrevin [Thraustotheca clavata]|uniref:Synaptobrevin n=1 Tax=Thraustotheca clavata TaxID=74557 RepID=A0A1V9ZQQ4_9STRA|nr:synaptobrevin [Thraustotheca clavata]
MVKILSLGILRQDIGSNAVILANAFELNSFNYFQRSSVREMITFFSRTFIERTQKGQRQSIQHEEYFCHVYVRQDGLAGIVVCDEDYPPRVAFALINKVLEEYNEETVGSWVSNPGNKNLIWAPLNKALQDYQGPTKADKISAIQKELDETTAVLSETVDNVLFRGEILDDLVARSADLSIQSQTFYCHAKRTNSCCVVM